jgi:uncharacterized damage-inducible protein DinB
MSETNRIWDLMQRAYEGNTWHGPGLRPLLEDVTGAQAEAHPIPGARSIWETILHLAAQEEAVRRRLDGEHVEELPPAADWPPVTDAGPEAWRRDLHRFEEAHQRLRDRVWDFPEASLSGVVPGRDYPYYLMLYGVIQHDLYHAGQIAMLMQAQGVTPRG